MSRTMTTMIAVLALAAGLSAQHGKTEAPSLTGTWNMGLEGDHVIPVALVLKQDGRRSPARSRCRPIAPAIRSMSPLKGEIADGAFTLSGTVEGAKEPTTIDISGKLNDEGMLEGKVDDRRARRRARHDMP